MAGVAGIFDWARQQVAARVPKADLDQRDPDFIRDQLPGLWLLASLYFRADVRGLDRIPAQGPVLLVGNHSGGNVPPDTFVFTLAFCSYFGVERPFYQLVHNLVALISAGRPRGRGGAQGCTRRLDRATDFDRLNSNASATVDAQDFNGATSHLEHPADEAVGGDIASVTQIEHRSADGFYLRMRLRVGGQIGLHLAGRLGLG